MKRTCLQCDLHGNIKCIFCRETDFEEIKTPEGYMGPGGYYKCLKCGQSQGYYVNMATEGSKFPESNYPCYLCNEDIPREEIFNDDLTIVFPDGKIAHRQCQSDAEADGSMEK